MLSKHYHHLAFIAVKVIRGYAYSLCKIVSCSEEKACRGCKSIFVCFMEVQSTNCKIIIIIMPININEIVLGYIDYYVTWLLVTLQT